MSNAADRPLRFAIIGCGRIAGQNIWAIGQIPGATLAAVCDLREERAADYGRKHGVPAYTNYHRMLREQAIDVVCLMTPSGMHATHALDVIRTHRKHVVVEKPLALRLDEAEALQSAAAAAGVRLFTVLQNRFNRPVQRIRELFETGAFGKPVLGTVRLRWCRPQRYYDRDPWRGRWAFDGGVLTNQAIHHLDLLQWFLGEVEEVSATAVTRLVDVEVEDTALGWLRFRNGALGAIEATTAARPDDLEASLSLLGENGSVIIEGTSVNRVVHWSFPGGDPASLSETPPSVYGYGHLPLLRNVATVLRGGTAPVIEGEEGLTALRILHALYRAIETGQPVRMADRPVSARLGRVGPADEPVRQSYLTPPWPEAGR